LTGQVPTFTTIAGARAAVMGMAQMRDLVAYPLQALHRTL
jgi:hypothetical protein